MGHPFEQRRQADVPATPDEVWAAIASGPGIDSWFMGRSAVQPGADGTVRTVFGEYAPELGVTAWDPARRFAYRSDEAADGRFIAYEFLIEGRAGGSTVLRAVTSGFLPGDDWADEFEAMTLGGELYFRTLVEYLTHFAGRFAAPVTAFGPPGTTWTRDRALLCRALGLPEDAKPGDPAWFTTDEAAGPADGVVYVANAHTIGIRTPDALYRFLRGFGKPALAAHHLFAEDADPAQAERAWAGLAAPHARLTRRKERKEGNPMDTVRSADGTPIAFTKAGQGPPLILVDGALCSRSFGPMPKLATLLAPHFTVYTYDRRGRGASGDTLPYAAAREVDDLEALTVLGRQRRRNGARARHVVRLRARPRGGQVHPRDREAGGIRAAVHRGRHQVPDTR